MIRYPKKFLMRIVFKDKPKLIYVHTAPSEYLAFKEAMEQYPDNIEIKMRPVENPKHDTD